jgi:putative endonuclease
MSKTHLEFARAGEREAVDFLKAQGYQIIARNYKTKFAEIDIIAKEKDTLAFVEVKARHTDAFGAPEAAVNKFKQGQISKAALLFLKENSLLEAKARFDIVSILYQDAKPQIKLIKNAFELDNRYSY